ncbi:MAG: PaaI family thioesterase [Parvibaculum sp.]|jgi:acyl-coenzyme A thioesterase PaaI-like protein|uniref:PaaI family thioesterase n=1 Tax=Parvibaculum sp. TaxID=2024848 RepID=UPI00283BF340|nr:PaaI family thioesterase [Parvibaculum sp.]MDR3498918.1 PaaI family thioesterase [Parvibaculum sp.]
MTEARDATRPPRVALPSPVEAEAPEGFAAIELYDPFEAHVGPLFERVEADGGRVSAFRVDGRHVREDGTAHEGMMMTFADAFMGGAAWRGTDGQPCVTLSLQTSHLGDAKLGEVVECRARVEHRTRAIVFVSATFTVAGEPVMTATSLWKILGAR